ncbi:hypothetical protein [Candidatus Kuenenia stuttgartiensis]|uniref:hypothetical protein n=1 Tax=Kuenenia stuttgartiensis TaxID=174633 RepID=UPI00146A9E6B|nr:hypothetical protein [Candidatus Kuenenia stuttgartiensis]
MPRGVLPVRHDHGPEIDPGRLVYTDPDDFMELIQYLEERYFSRTNYFLIDNMPLFSIFDSAFFLRQLGVDLACKAIKRAKEYLVRKGYRGLHIMAINPPVTMIMEFKRAGFDSLSHYVWLPEWKGGYLQDYGELTGIRSGEWNYFGRRIKPCLLSFRVSRLGCFATRRITWKPKTLPLSMVANCGE